MAVESLAGARDGASLHRAGEVYVVTAREGANQPSIPRLNPQALRNAPPYFGTGLAQVFQVEAERPLIITRKSFLECDAEFNPLGKFGASFSRHL